MQNPESLSIEYYPARRCIRFALCKGDKVDSKPENEYPSLAKYSIEKKDGFVLNLCGDEFFDDILKPFAGESHIPVSIKTTRADYEDFKILADSYNGLGKAKIELNQLTEEATLLDMAETFKKLKEQSTQMHDALKTSLQNISEISCSSANSKEYIKRISERIKKQADSIYKELSELENGNAVTLCFLGAYSSGKSTLINALLGYRVLPEALHSETAKMIRISGAKTLEDTTVHFEAADKKTEALLKWDSRSTKFFFDQCNVNDELRGDIQKALSPLQGKQLHEQLYGILDFLNKQEGIASVVDVSFPISLDSEELHFVICDTPGTDSNYGEHKLILSKALREQTHSIAIFVFKPDSMEGTATNRLLSEVLRGNEHHDTMIDMEHSFFVINKCDSNRKYYQLENSNLPVQQGRDISLAEKKLFFMSALQAYYTRVMKNKIIIENSEDADYFQSYVPLCCKSPYYKHNHLGRSHYLTNQMLDRADTELHKAEKAGDDFTKYEICSGLFSFEQEIVRYGERYALSTKTMAIINSMEGILDNLKKMVKETEIGEISDQASDRLNFEIKKLKDIIEKKRRSFVKIPDDINNELGIDSNSFVDNVQKPVMKKIDKKFGILPFSTVKDQDKKALQAEVATVVGKYYETYRQKRYRHLADVRKNFIDDLMSDIENDADVSDELKDCIKNFSEPHIPDAKISEKIDELFSAANVLNFAWLKKIVSASAKAAQFVNGKLDGVKEPKIQVKTENQFLKKGADIVSVGAETVLGGMKWLTKKSAEGLETLNEVVQPFEVKTLSKFSFKDGMEAYLHEKQESVTTGLRKDYTDSLNELCSDIATEFSGNIDRFSTKVKALKEDAVPLERLAAEVENLNTTLQGFDFGGMAK